MTVDEWRCESNIWRDRWRQLMRDHEQVVAERDCAEAKVERLREYIDRMPYPSDMDQLRAERDRAEATIARVRKLIAEWEFRGAASTPFPDRVALDVDTEVLDPLRNAIEGTDA